MNNDIRRLMEEATRLTRSGDLQAATAAIQAALGRGAAPAPNSARDACDVIDVEARVLPGAVTDTDTDTDTAAQPYVDVPPAGEFISGRFASATDARNYKLFVPPQAGARALPLVVMLHGCTQTPDDFAAGTAMNDAALAQGFFVLYPAQSRQANPQGCWNWFKHSHQQRGRGEPALLAGMVQQVMARYAIDPQRVYVAGLSAGGAMAAIVGDAYPDLFAAVGVHSGLAAGAASDLPGALMAMNGAGAKAGAGDGASGVPTIVFHGDADATVHVNNSAQVIAASAGKASVAEAEHVQGDGRRSATRHVHRSADGRVVAEQWIVHGAPHAWAGGSTTGSYTDPRGPDATREMVRFFLDHPRRPSH